LVERTTDRNRHIRGYRIGGFPRPTGGGAFSSRQALLYNDHPDAIIESVPSGQR
jgi:hypothetical protein